MAPASLRPPTCCSCELLREQTLNRTADERIVGNESQDETLAGGSPGCGTRITKAGHFGGDNDHFSNFPHHPLHLLGDLVAAQVVVEGSVSPVATVVGDRIGPLSVHFGNHGLFLFLQEIKTQKWVVKCIKLMLKHKKSFVVLVQLL